MIYYPLVEMIRDWWHSWWGKDEYQEYPIKPLRVILFCLYVMVGFGISITVIIMLYPYLAAVGVFLLCLGIIGIRISNKFGRVTYRAWLRGFGYWWQ